jgi:hypothetical protein
MVNLMLTILYYVYNWAPLTRGSGYVAYTLAMGMMLSIGWEVTGRIPPGKVSCQLRSIHMS